MPIIMTQNEVRKNKTDAVADIQKGDIINGVKFNALSSPVTAKIAGGGEWWIESLDVQTGLMRLDICGQIDLCHFCEVIELIDYNGNKYDPDDFWINE